MYNNKTEMIESKVGSTLTKKTNVKMTSKVKTKTVVGYPEGVISVLSDLIQKGEVNVVFFDGYEKMFSPDELEEKLSKTINLNNGWECEYMYCGDKKWGLKYNRLGENRIKDESVWKYLRKNGFYVPLYFSDEDVRINIDWSVSDYGYETFQEMFHNGLTKEEILEDEDRLWDGVDRVVDYYLDEEVQELFKSYRDREDYTLMDYTYDLLRDHVEFENEFYQEECQTIKK